MTNTCKSCGSEVDKVCPHGNCEGCGCKECSAGAEKTEEAPAETPSEEAAAPSE